MKIIKKHLSFVLNLLCLTCVVYFGFMLASCGDGSKHSYDMSGITFEDASYEYNGSSYQLAIGGTLPEGVTVSYANNDKIEPGVYEVVASFKGDEQYSPIEDMTATLTINKDKVEVPNLVNNVFNYDGSDKTIEMNGYSTDLMGYTGDFSATKVGEYQIQVALKDQIHYEWKEAFSGLLKWNIVKSAISSISFEDNAFTYDGESHSLAIKGNLPKGVTVTYSNNEQTNTGTYQVVAHFTDSTGNYNVPEDMTATLTINKCKVALPTISNHLVAYNGNEQTITVTGYNSKLMTQTGELSAKEVGNYSVNYSLISSNNYEWESSFDGKLHWSILDLSFTYTVDENQNVTVTGLINKASTDLSIPSSFQMDSKNYIVTTIGNQAFIHHPLNDYDFIIENNHLIGFDKAGVRHCILVKGETSDFGILVDSEGSSYARYAACIPLSNLSLK